MKYAVAVIFSGVLAFAVGQVLPGAQPCDEEQCRLPFCRCSTPSIPGALAAHNIPQIDTLMTADSCSAFHQWKCALNDETRKCSRNIKFVLLTFDDGVNVNNMVLYRQLLRNRFNSNSCRAAATFFVSHEYTDYTLVNELYNAGHEIALHSISHRTDIEYWRDANFTTMMREIGDQRAQMAHFANIPVNSIHGVRLPFLQMAGNSSFQMMASAGLTYDSSWPTIAYRDPGLWPYTLDFKSTQDCMIPPCPNASIPGPWVLPMVTWTDLQGVPCAMVDTCFHVPHGADETGWYNLILSNFERHYRGNRAPFGFYVHEWYVRVNPGLRFALERFMDLINSLNDAFMVNAKEVTDWVQNPVPVSVYRQRACRNPMQTQCIPNFCGPLPVDDKNYYMQVCSQCPRVYPWVNNPLGR